MDGPDDTTDGDGPEDARQQAYNKQREKDAKARARRARNDRRKLLRLRQALEESGELSDWEDEFSSSVSERLDTYGSAFQDREKGRPSDALSYAQKKVMAALRAKAKKAAKSATDESLDEQDDRDSSRGFKSKPSKSGFKSKSSFKSKSGFKPRVRHIEDDMTEETSPPVQGGRKDDPYIPDYNPDPRPAAKPAAKRPFLRLVKNEDDDA